MVWNRENGGTDAYEAMKKKKLIVIGGGAAGFFCAVNAAKNNPQLEVTILEKTHRLLSKVSVSGGGRCNVTHACFDPDDMSKQYPRGGRMMKHLLHTFGPTETIQWFKHRGIELVTEPDGRMFPSTNTSKTIVDCLLREAEKYQVSIVLRKEVVEIEWKEGFLVTTSDGHRQQADFVCVASGGYPKLEQFKWLQKLGHHIEAPVPSLFTFNIPDEDLRRLMGISVNPAGIALEGSRLKEEGPLLITHWGISGPAALRLSAFAARKLADMHYTGTLKINWIPSYHETALREQWPQWRKQFGGQKVAARSPFTLPTRLWQYLLGKAGVAADKSWADVSSAEQNRLIQLLLNTTYSFKGKTTFKEEFVTCGGIALNEIHPQTMESKLVPGLFFCGEVVDVDGVTGGFNFQHAWASGWTVAQAIVNKCQ
ncbi:MAG: NAD(P)/FAD-dependent oxidoreductase [Bacteroidota bacterium]